MINHDFTALNVSDSTVMDAYVAIPEGAGPFPGLILCQEAFGVNSHIRNVAERLCQAGYAVIAPDFFHRTATRLEIPYPEFEKARVHYMAITTEGQETDLRAAYDWLRQQPVVNADKIGAIGFCLGGRITFLANTILPLSAAVSYYGGGINMLADRAHELHCPHLFYWGGLDKHITPDLVSQTIEAVKATGKPYTNVVISYADHGFHCDERGSYHPQAAREAWAHTLAFLANQLV